MTSAITPVAPARARSGGLAALVEPRAIALVGASPDADKLSGRPLAYLRRYGFRGGIYPVNPKYADIDGARCYASVEDLPDDTDLALILLPATAVASALEACGRRGIPFAISVAGGFAEAGAAKAQQQLVDICRRCGIRLVGPNCVGLLNPRAGVTATFSTTLRTMMPRPGGTVLLTQSGALGNALLQGFNELDLGLAAWVSTGNEADLGVLEFVEHFLDDPQVRLIALFVEGLKHGERLLPLGRRARLEGKAIVALRAGRSLQGRSASVSHTGKMAGAWRIWQDIARQAGIIEVETLDELLDVITAFDVLGDAHGDAAQGLGVLTISGGLGVLISDVASQHSLPLPPFAAATQERLRTVLPPQMAVANPVDTALFTDEKGYATCASAVLDDPAIGTLLLILTRLAHDYDALTPWIESLGRQARERGKHVALSFLASCDVLSRESRQRLFRAGVLVLPTAERVVAALGRRAAREAGADVTATLPLQQAAPGDALAGTFLVRAGIALVAEKLCRTADESAAFARENGFPVALKIASADLPHKTDVGGVRLGLRDETELRRAWQEMMAAVADRAPGARIDGATVQPMITDGVELILGGSIDPEFGRVAMIGAGGIWTEVMQDMRFIGLPATDAEIAEALDALRISSLLRGARGKAPADIAAAVRAISGLCNAFLADESVGEVDINPLLVRPAGLGVVAVDALVVPLAAGYGQPSP